jgi:hypothetical protein
MIHALRLAAAMTLDHRPDAATATRHRTLAFGDRHFSPNTVVRVGVPAVLIFGENVDLAGRSSTSGPPSSSPRVRPGPIRLLRSHG